MEGNHMKHNGSCSKTCGHALDITTVKANPETQRQLDRDPRVVEYTELDPVEHGGDWFKVVYAYRRPVAAIYRADAAALGMRDLA